MENQAIYTIYIFNDYTNWFIKKRKREIQKKKMNAEKWGLFKLLETSKGLYAITNNTIDSMMKVFKQVRALNEYNHD